MKMRKIERFDGSSGPPEDHGSTVVTRPCLEFDSEHDRDRAAKMIEAWEAHEESWRDRIEVVQNAARESCAILWRYLNEANEQIAELKADLREAWASLREAWASRDRWEDEWNKAESARLQLADRIEELPDERWARVREILGMPENPSTTEVLDAIRAAVDESHRAVELEDALSIRRLKKATGAYRWPDVIETVEDWAAERSLLGRIGIDELTKLRDRIAERMAQDEDVQETVRKNKEAFDRLAEDLGVRVSQTRDEGAVAAFKKYLEQSGRGK